MDNEEVTSMSLNKSNSSLILIYFPRNELDQRILCKSITIRFVVHSDFLQFHSNIIKCKYEVFEEPLKQELLVNPSFVEIDEFHEVMLSFCAVDK